MYAEATADQVARLRNFGQSVGLSFQIVDDVLDVTSSTSTLGKTAGRDVVLGGQGNDTITGGTGKYEGVKGDTGRPRLRNATKGDPDLPPAVLTGAPGFNRALAGQNQRHAVV